MHKVERDKIVKIVRNKVSGTLLFAGAVLILTNITFLILKYGFEHQNLLEFIRLFDFNQRGSLPHYFISFLFLVSSILLCIIAMSHKSEEGQNWISWSILSFVFLTMSLTKLLQLMDIPMKMLWKVFTKSGLNNLLSWNFFKVTLLVLFLTLFLKFFLQLPSRVRLSFLFAAIVLFGGGLGGDILSHKFYTSHDPYNLGYNVISVVEESMEMLGGIVLIHALLGYLAEYAPRKVFIITTRE